MALTLELPVRQAIDRRRRKTHDQRIAQRLSALLGVAAGRDQHQVAGLLGVTQRQVRKGLRTYRDHGLEALGTLHPRGAPGKLRHAQTERLKAEIATGRFLAARPIGAWIAEPFHVTYTPRGVRDL